MELQFYFYLAYFFVGLFLAYMILLLSRINFKQTLESAIQQHYIKEEAAEKGLKPFAFENGKVVIYAKTQMRAMLKYKTTRLRNSFAARRTAKKV